MRSADDEKCKNTRRSHSLLTRIFQVFRIFLHVSNTKTQRKISRVFSTVPTRVATKLTSWSRGQIAPEHGTRVWGGGVVVRRWGMYPGALRG